MDLRAHSIRIMLIIKSRKTYLVDCRSFCCYTAEGLSECRASTRIAGAFDEPNLEIPR